MIIHNVRVRLLSETARFPVKAHVSDGAYDLHADNDALIRHSSFETVGTGIALDLPTDLCALVLSRSGLAAKSGVFVLNSPGLIDPGYQGEIKVVLFNAAPEAFVINAGDRIAQLMFTRVEAVNLREAFSVLPSDRGENGLGSTGIGNILLLHGYEDEDDVPVAPA